MIARHDEHVPTEQRPEVQERDDMFIGEHDMRRLASRDDATEHAGLKGIGHRRQYRCTVFVVRVSLFVTCLVDAFSPSVGTATVDVLRRMGHQVDVPEGQTCCGQPAWNAGFARDAARVAATSLDALDAAGSEAIVVPAGSCATMMKVFWPELFETVGDHDRAATARALAGRIHEFSAFVDAHRDELPELSAADETVAYHHSCHMLRELRIDDAPERLLDAAGYERSEWSADRRCCGFGGLFSVKLPETSVTMADEKLSTLDGASVIVGSDASCLMHLCARADKEGISISTRHLAEVLSDSLRDAEDAGT